MKSSGEQLRDGLVAVAVGVDVVGPLLTEWQHQSAVQVVIGSGGDQVSTGKKYWVGVEH